VSAAKTFVTTYKTSSVRCFYTWHVQGQLLSLKFSNSWRCLLDVDCDRNAHSLDITGVLRLEEEARLKTKKLVSIIWGTEDSGFSATKSAIYSSLLFFGFSIRAITSSGKPACISLRSISSWIFSIFPMKFRAALYSCEQSNIPNFCWILYAESWSPHNTHIGTFYIFMVEIRGRCLFNC